MGGLALWMPAPVSVRPAVLLAIILAAGMVDVPQAAFGQSLSIGLVGGAAVTDGFRTQTVPVSGNYFIGMRFFSTSKDYIAGASIEMHFTPHWSIEADGMFRELHLTWAAVQPDGALNSVSPAPVVTWEFPVLAKYRFRLGNFRPFSEAGPSFRTAGNLNLYGTNPAHFGFTTGVGVERNLRGLKIAPVVRYTRWTADHVAEAPAPTSNTNQVELLVGFSRASESAGLPRFRAVSLGALVGTNLTGAYSTVASGCTNTRSPIAGASLEVHLPRALSVEVDAIHRPVSAYGEALYAGGLIGRFDNTFETWEFPVLAKYRFPLRIRGLQPFAEAGPSFRLVGSLTDSSEYGVFAGAGIEARLRRIRVAPVIRYTRWGPDRFTVTVSPLRNQLDLLVGVSF